MTALPPTPMGIATLGPLLPLVALSLLAACNGDGADAYGNFESTEVTVSAEATGVLVRLEVAEGQVLPAGAVVARIDTIQLGLERRELEAQVALSASRTDEARAALGALEAQLATARDDLERTRRLYDREAATASQLNQLQGQVTALEEQVNAARVRVRMTVQESRSLEVRMARVEDRLRRASVVNPVAGTALSTFVEEGEFVQAGRPLYVVAPLDTLVLRAYVSGNQLSRLSLDQAVTTRFDAGDGTLATRTGRLSWISASAEFTPTPIQTREERVDQVYAIKIRVPNPDGALKIGMPGEVLFGETGS